MKNAMNKLWDEYFYEECAEAIYKGEGAHVKKAFFKGCEFAASFFVSLGISAEK